MKRIYLIFIVLSVAVVSCTENFEEYNTDDKNPTQVEGEFLFTQGQKELVDQISSTNVNLNIWKLWSQYWTETTYTDEENYDIINRTIADNAYDIYYTNVLKSFDEARKLIEADELQPSESEAQKNNKLLIIDLMEVYAYHNLVNIFGNVPYNDAMDIDQISPAYEDAASIYSDLMSRVNNAIDNLNANAPSFTSADAVYNGDVESWLRFANSLKLKIAINVADVSDQVDFDPQTAAEEAVDAGVISSAGENATLEYEGSSPNTNPLHEDLVLSGRKDFVPANTLVNQLATKQDPRIDDYLDKPIAVSFPVVNEEIQNDTLEVSTPILFYYNDGTRELVEPDSIYDMSPAEGATSDSIYGIIVPAEDADLEPTYYWGGQYGYQASYAGHSHIDSRILEATFPGFLMTYSEVQFYIAEAAARGYSVGQSAEEAYDAGVTASIVYWGGSETEAENYLNEHPYDANNWKASIGLQSWFASYTRGFIGYTTYRRLDEPDIMNTPDPDVYKTTDGVIPTRFTYPVNEQTLNAENYQEAASAIGGDDLETTLFWDISTPY